MPQLARRADLRRRLRLTVITDRRLAGEAQWLNVVGAALEAGATAVQLRDKDATSEELLELASELHPLCARYGSLFIVNDRFDLALAAGADGVHLGPDDLPVRRVRRVVPVDFAIGRSVDTEEAGRTAVLDGADYLGVGSVFGTRSKGEVIGEAIGTERLAAVVRAVDVPVVGIGGVTAANAAAVARAGAAGIAVISAVMSAPDPAADTSELLEVWERGAARG